MSLEQLIRSITEAYTETLTQLSLYRNENRLRVVWFLWIERLRSIEHGQIYNILVRHFVIPSRLRAPTAIADLQIAIGLQRLATILEENLLQTIEVFVITRYLWHNVFVLNADTHTIQAASAVIRHIRFSSA